VLADDAPAALCARLATESDNGHPPTLEDAFLRLVGRRLDEDVDTSEDDGHG
jgi:hypothetical protein